MKQLRDLITAVCTVYKEAIEIFLRALFDAFCINIASTVLW